MANGTDRHFARLTECVDWSRTRGQPYRDLNQLLVDAAMGEYYPRFIGPKPDVPINLMWMTHRAMSRWLYMRNPRGTATTQPTPWKSFAEDAAMALNRTIVAADFGSTISKVVDQSLYSVGALFLSADYVGDEEGMKQKLVLENVPFADLVWDVGCRDMRESDYLGRKAYVKLIDVRQHPLLDPESRAKVQASRVDGSDDVANWQRASGSFHTDLYDYVELYQVWDRADNRMYVWPCDQKDLMLMGEKWSGPRQGPIRLLHYGSPPGHPYPVAPMASVYRLARAANILLTKALQQQQVSKGLLLYTSAQKDEAKDVVDSPDLNSVLQEHGPLRWTHTGGADPATVSMAELARKLFGYAVGNLDQLLGLSTQAPTLGQERMLGEATTANMQDMAEEVNKFVKGAVTDAYWFNIRAPKGESRLWKQLGRTGLSYDVPWTPEKRRQIEEMDFEIDVEPYSYRSRTPDGRLADFLGALQVLGQWSPQMAAQGMMLDMDAIFRIIAKYKDLPELHEAVITNQDPQRLSELMGSRAGQAPTSAMGKPNGNYTRRSESDGAGENLELLRMMGNGQNQAVEAA